MNAATTSPALLAAAHRAAQIAECAEMDVDFALVSGAHWSQVDQARTWARAARRASDRAFAALD